MGEEVLELESCKKLIMSRITQKINRIMYLCICCRDYFLYFFYNFKLR